MKNIALLVVLLACSNTFMTLAWYAHLRHLREKPWLVAALVSWGIALFEYLLQVPANRIGYQSLDLGQLKVVQEVVALVVFVPVAALILHEKPRPGYYLAALCLAAAVYFAFSPRFAR